MSTLLSECSAEMSLHWVHNKTKTVLLTFLLDYKALMAALLITGLLRPGVYNANLQSSKSGQKVLEIAFYCILVAL